MKKIFFRSVIFCLLSIAISMAAFAGDVAVFQEIGFSKDGKTYIFGEYGKTDKKFIPYSEIYCVDVAKNEYIPGKVFKSQDKACLKHSKEVFEDLLAKCYTEINKFESYQAEPADVLYIMEEEKKGATEEICFTSFEESEYKYNVKLVPTFKGKKSSFYINVEIYDQDGVFKDSWNVGTPSVERQNVTGYRIIRIATSKNKESVVFVVEKTIEDASGTSIRYMVETKKLDKPIDGIKR